MQFVYSVHRFKNIVIPIYDAVIFYFFNVLTYENNLGRPVFVSVGRLLTYSVRTVKTSNAKTLYYYIIIGCPLSILLFIIFFFFPLPRTRDNIIRSMSRDAYHRRTYLYVATTSESEEILSRSSEKMILWIKMQ